MWKRKYGLLVGLSVSTAPKGQGSSTQVKALSYSVVKVLFDFQPYHPTIGTIAKSENEPIFSCRIYRAFRKRKIPPFALLDERDNRAKTLYRG